MNYIFNFEWLTVPSVLTFIMCLKFITQIVCCAEYGYESEINDKNCKSQKCQFRQIPQSEKDKVNRRLCIVKIEGTAPAFRITSAKIGGQ